jgi:hypothetical protein
MKTAKQILGTTLPADGGNPSVGCETRDSEVPRRLSDRDFLLDDNEEDLQSTGGRISRDQLGDRALELLLVMCLSRTFSQDYLLQYTCSQNQR